MNIIYWIGTAATLMAGLMTMVGLMILALFFLLDRLSKFSRLLTEFYRFLWYRQAFRAWLKDRECKS